MTETPLDRLMDIVARGGQGIFHERGEIRHPMFFGQDHAGHVTVLMVKELLENKDLGAMIVGAALSENECVRYVFMAETWFTSLVGMTPEQAKAEPMPSEHPDRREAVFLYGEDADGTRRARTYEIVRGTGVTLRRLDDDGPGGEFEGRFTGLLRAQHDLH